MSTPSSLLRSLGLVVLTSLPALAQSVTATVTAATQLIVTAGTNTNTRSAGTNLNAGLNLGTSYQSGPIFVTVNSVFGLSSTSTSITHTIQESMTGVNATRSAGTRPVVVVVVVQVDRMRVEASADRGLADLARPDDEGHLAFGPQVPPEHPGQAPAQWVWHPTILARIVNQSRPIYIGSPFGRHGCARCPTRATGRKTSRISILRRHKRTIDRDYRFARTWRRFLSRDQV